MQRYNLALVPVAGADRAALIEWHHVAAAVSVGYVADGVRGHPHVTLCQFSINSVGHNIDRHLLGGHSSVGVRFLGCRRRTGVGNHQGYDWIEIAVERSPELSRMQVGVWAALQALGATLYTALGDGYHPHVTLARVVAGDTTVVMPQNTAGQTMPMRPALFSCSANGECLTEFVLA